jgi:hypothetical protein
MTLTDAQKIEIIDIYVWFHAHKYGITNTTQLGVLKGLIVGWVNGPRSTPFDFSYFKIMYSNTVEVPLSANLTVQEALEIDLKTEKYHRLAALANSDEAVDRAGYGLRAPKTGTNPRMSDTYGRGGRVIAQIGIPMGGIPMGGIPMGGIPMGGIPMGGIHMGGIPMGGIPMGGIHMSGVPMSGFVYDPVNGVFRPI